MFINIIINTRKETTYHYVEVDENENLDDFIKKFLNVKFIKPVIFDIYKFYEYNSKTDDFIQSFAIYKHDITIKDRTKGEY